MNKFNLVKKELEARFLEREDHITGMLVALLSDNNVIFLGPPGTAKSALARELCSRITMGKYYEWLVTADTMPEDLFGPHSLPALQEGKFERVVTDKLPEANIAFLDEIFKGHGTILNSLLPVLNERKFFNNGVIDLPLLMVVAASNELPEDKNLAAFWDRFVLRYVAGNLKSPQSRMAFLQGAVQRALGTQTTQSRTVISIEEIKSARKEVTNIMITDKFLTIFFTLWETMEKEGFYLSERTIEKFLRIFQAHAYLEGRNEVGDEDFSILANTFWNRYEEIPKLKKIILEVCNPLELELREILDMVDEEMAKINQVKDSREVLKTATESYARLQVLIKDINKIEEQIKTKKGDLTKTEKAKEKIQNCLQDIVKITLNPTR